MIYKGLRDVVKCSKSLRIDRELLRISQEALAIFAFSYLAGWIDLCFSAYFTALDMPARSLLVSFVGTLVLPIALLVLLPQAYGLSGIWLMPPLASVISGVFTLWLYKGSKIRIDNHRQRL